MKQLKQSFHLLYNEGCSPTLRSFDSDEQRKMFIAEFTLKHLHNTEDNWVDLVFDGEIVNKGTGL